MSEEDEREQAKLRLSLLEVVLAALDRRAEVVETVWESRDRADAAERLRVLLGLPAGTPAEVVLDLQVGRFTAERRQALAREVADLRQTLRTR
ncbi:hypothetical protein [Nocardioides pantholopis]|uniref:hypothetical protein n=1 Tax=Nocardioides pantholopis TaxID=2483798 RepID=UPI0013DE1374|nr:hypothetical protein [Nocardioides pantholopis]